MAGLAQGTAHLNVARKAAAAMPARSVKPPVCHVCCRHCRVRRCVCRCRCCRCVCVSCRDEARAKAEAKRFVRYQPDDLDLAAEEAAEAARLSSLLPQLQDAAQREGGGGRGRRGGKAAADEDEVRWRSGVLGCGGRLSAVSWDVKTRCGPCCKPESGRLHFSGPAF